MARALEQQEAREQQQAPLASVPQDRAPLWVPLAAQRARREPAQRPEAWEPLSAQREPPDGLPADVPQVHVPQAQRGQAPRASPGLRLLHEVRDV